MNKKRILGIFLIIVSIIILGINSVATGAVIGLAPRISLNLISVAFLVAGIVLFLSSGLEKKINKFKIQLEQTLQSGKMGSYSELSRIAKKMGYEIKDGGRHDLVYKGKVLVTQIPRHAKNEHKGTYRDIVSNLIRYAA